MQISINEFTPLEKRRAFEHISYTGCAASLELLTTIIAS